MPRGTEGQQELVTVECMRTLEFPLLTVGYPHRSVDKAEKHVTTEASTGHLGSWHNVPQQSRSSSHHSSRVCYLVKRKPKKEQVGLKGSFSQRLAVVSEFLLGGWRSDGGSASEQMLAWRSSDSRQTK
jgi:hypothetical protein